MLVVVFGGSEIGGMPTCGHDGKTGDSQLAEGLEERCHCEIVGEMLG